MAKLTRQDVAVRAAGCCEYCRMPQSCDVRPFQVDHIRAQKHGGRTTLSNSAWSCLPCNSYKGPNIAGHDDETGTLVPLFNPRSDNWDKHFHWDGPRLVGKTPIGRTTIVVLRINNADRVEHRRLLIASGEFPPSL